MNIKYFAAIAFLAFTSSIIGQTLSVEKIWKEYAFFGKSVEGFRSMNNGEYFSKISIFSFFTNSLKIGKAAEIGICIVIIAVNIAIVISHLIIVVNIVLNLLGSFVNHICNILFVFY